LDPKIYSSINLTIKLHCGFISAHKMNNKIAVIAVALGLGLVATNTVMAGDDTFCAASKSLRYELQKADEILQRYGIIDNSAHQVLKKWDEETMKPATAHACHEDQDSSTDDTTGH
jgi:hypothetical protein